MSVRLSPPPTNLITYLTLGGEQVKFTLPYQMLVWLNSIFDRVGEGPLGIQGYLKDDLPDATEAGSTTGDVFSSLIFVADATGGPTVAFSDGTNWLRISDNTVIN